MPVAIRNPQICADIDNIAAGERIPTSGKALLGMTDGESREKPYFPNLKNITHAQKDCNGFGENLRKNIIF